MSKRRQVIFPKYDQILEQMGENIKLARKKRKLTATSGIIRAHSRHVDLSVLSRLTGLQKMTLLLTISLIKKIRDFLI